MESEEASYPLPHGERVWVIKTSTAADLLPQMLERFRFGHTDPLIFGDAARPEGVVVSFELWRTLDTRVFDQNGSDTTYTTEPTACPTPPLNPHRASPPTSQRSNRSSALWITPARPASTSILCRGRRNHRKDLDELRRNTAHSRQR